jgi:hypothetical protein
VLLSCIDLSQEAAKMAVQKDAAEKKTAKPLQAKRGNYVSRWRR